MASFLCWQDTLRARIHFKGECLNAALTKNSKCLAQQDSWHACLAAMPHTYSTDLLMMIIRRRSHCHSQFWLAHPERKPIMSGDCTATEKVWRRGNRWNALVPACPLQDLSLFAALLLNTVVALLTRGLGIVLVEPLQ